MSDQLKEEPAAAPPRRRWLKIVSLAIGVSVLVLVVLFLTVGIPVGLGGFREKLEQAAGEALNCEVRIEGSVGASIGLNTEVSIEGLVIANPEGWEGEAPQIARMEKLVAGVSLPSVLAKKLVVQTFEVDGLALTLEENSAGESNWTASESDGGDESEPAPSAEKEESSGDGEKFQLVALRELIFRNISVSHQSEGQTAAAVYRLDEMTGSAGAEDPTKLDLTGTIKDKPLELSFEAGPLPGFLRHQPDWPIAFSGRLGGIQLSGEGRTAGEDAPEEGYLDFKFGVDDLKKFGDAIGASLPSMGAIEMSGRVTDNQGGIRLENLKGVVGDSEVTGKLDVDRRTSPPRVSGELQLSSIDVAVFKSKKGSKDSAPASPAPASPPSQPDGEALPVEEIRFPFTGQIVLGVGEILNAGVEVREFVLDAGVAESEINATVSVKLGGSLMEGPLHVGKRAEDGLEGFDIDLRGANDDIHGLFLLYTGSADFSGPYDKVRFHLFGYGERLAAGWKTRRTELAIDKVLLTKRGDEKNLIFDLDKAEIMGTQGEPTTHRARGRFKETPFSVEYVRLKPEKAAAGKEPILDLSAEIAGTTLSMKGVTRREKTDPVLPLTIAVSSPRLGGLAALAGISPDAETALELTSQIYLGDGGWRLEGLDAVLGSTTIKGGVGMGGTVEDPLLHADLDIGELVVAELTSIFPAKEKKPEDADPAAGDGENDPGLDLNMPILPTELNVQDMDIKLAVKRIVFESRELDDLQFEATIREGWMDLAPFGLSVGDQRLGGEMAFDFRGTKPEAALNLTLENADLGALLDKLNIAKGLKIEARRFAFKVHARGTTLKEILLQSDLDASFEDGSWTIVDANTKAELPILIRKGAITGLPGEDTRVTFDGQVLDTPLAFSLETDGLDAFWASAEKFDLKMEAKIAETDAVFQGEVTLPLTTANVDLDLSIKGNRFSNWNDLAGVNLPPLGPYSIDGRFKLVDEGYSFTEFDFQLGSSELSGDLTVRTNVTPPRIDVDVSAPSIQINDFKAKGWSARKSKTVVKKTEPAESGDGKKDKKKKNGDLKKTLAAASETLDAILSPAVLNKQDAVVNVRVRQVRSGADRLGAGRLGLTLVNGQVRLDPVEVELPGGKVDAEFIYQPGRSTYRSALKVNMNGFDYGVLARSKDAKSKAGGLIDLDLDIDCVGVPMDKQPLFKANGHMKFEVCPRVMDAKVFDLWATNLLLALMPDVDPSDDAKMNVIQGDFKFEKGVMTPEAFVLDTTNVRATGSGEVDFTKGELLFRMDPYPKQPQFFSVETPITIKGTFDENKIGLGNFGFGGLAVRLVANTVSFPVMLFIWDRMPADGSDLSDNVFHKKE